MTFRFVASVTMTLTHHFLSCMSFLTTKEGVMFRCIRYHDIDPSFPFLYVFSDYKRGRDVSLHPLPWHWPIISCLACLFWLQKRTWCFVASVTMTLTHHFLSCMSFLTRKEDVMFRCIRYHDIDPSWLQKRTWCFVASLTMTLTHHFLCCMSFLTTKEDVMFRCIRYHDIDPSWLQKRTWCFVASVTLTLTHHFLSYMSFLPTDEGVMLSVTMTLTFRSVRNHHFLSCMSFLTTKEGVTFRCIASVTMTLTFWSASAKRFGCVTAAGHSMHHFRDFTTRVLIREDFFHSKHMKYLYIGEDFTMVGKDILVSLVRFYYGGERHSSHGQILDLYVEVLHVCQTKCNLWNTYNFETRISLTWSKIDLLYPCRFWFQVVMSYCFTRSITKIHDNNNKHSLLSSNGRQRYTTTTTTSKTTTTIKSQSCWKTEVV